MNSQERLAHLGGSYLGLLAATVLLISVGVL